MKRNSDFFFLNMGNDPKVPALVSRRAAVLREHSTVRTVFAGLCTGTQLQPDGSLTLPKKSISYQKPKEVQGNPSRFALSFQAFNFPPKPKLD